MKKGWEGERRTEREGGREGGREREREREGERGRERERGREGGRERDRERETDKERNRRCSHAYPPTRSTVTDPPKSTEMRTRNQGRYGAWKMNRPKKL